MFNSINTTKFNLFLAVRNGIYSIIGALHKIFPNKKPVIVVYCYHSISNSGWRFSVTKEDFESQINFLLKNKTPLKSSDLESYINGEKKLSKDAFVITFDDGYEDVLQVKDFLREKGIYPTMFLLSNPEQANRGELENDLSLLNNNQIRELVEAGWELGSHSATHADFWNLNKQEIIEEIGDSKNKLENNLNIPINYFAYPKGRYNKEVLEYISKSDYKIAFSVNDGYVIENTERLLVPRVGVDGTHSMTQFPYIALPLSMTFRKVIKKYFK